MSYEKYRSRAIALAHSILPRPAWTALLRLRGHHVTPREKWRDSNYQGLKTRHNARPLHVGRFATAFDRWRLLDQNHDADLLRYRVYNVCQFASLCSNIPGDFVSVGVSYGVSARTVFDYVNFPSLGKTMHLVDPLTGADGEPGKTRFYYNLNPDNLLAQFPKGAPIKLHREFAPKAFSLFDDAISFAFLNTGHAQSEAESIAVLYRRLTAGGIIIADLYAAGDGNFSIYDPYLRQIDTEPLWLPSGQCVIFK